MPKGKIETSTSLVYLEMRKEYNTLMSFDVTLVTQIYRENLSMRVHMIEKHFVSQVINRSI